MKKIFLLVMLLASHYSYADNCTIGGNPASSWAVQNYKVKFTTPVSIGKDTPGGSSLGFVTVGPGVSNVTILCPSQVGFHQDTGIYPTKSGLSGAYKTNVPGIGIQVQFGPSGAYGMWWEDQDDKYAGSIWNWNSIYAFKLVTTGEPLSGGTVNSGIIARTSMLHYSSGENTPLFTFTLNPPVVINIKACTVTTPTVNVPLGDVMKENFTNVGKVVAEKSFTVGLNCNASTPIKYTITGTKDTDTELNSVLALTNAGSPDVATGVGVQILAGGTPIDMDVRKSTSSFPADGVHNMSFSARYYQTLPTVTAGLANTTATLTLTYQ